jgi:hypothetical protein
MTDPNHPSIRDGDPAGSDMVVVRCLGCGSTTVMSAAFARHIPGLAINSCRRCRPGPQ